MPVYALGAAVPSISGSAYVHPEAIVIGNVFIGPHSTVWPGVVLRGDFGLVRIGSWVAVQDGTVVHGNVAGETVVGDECVIGHLAHLEGCRVGRGCLIGSGSIVMPLCEVADGATVGAGAVLPRGTTLPSGSAALGVPAVVRPDMPVPDRMTSAVRRHAELGERYRRELRRIHPGRSLD